jgi:predicted nucleotidyltransferase component of viral defense system
MFPNTLLPDAQKTLALLGKQNFLKKAYLAGDSALALQLGHRRSIDFDFFTSEEFETSYIRKELKKIGTYETEFETPKTMVGVFNKVKFSYFYYPYNLIRKTTDFLGINLASIEDIAAMKLVAITDRGTKKDFVDLYFLAKECFSLENMFGFYDEKYHLLSSNLLTLLKALSYFDDAEKSEMPEMLKKASWEEVKEFLQKETIRLARKYI